ncbi:MAG: TetR/AcrR family transcriptional regulator [Novosphingobium sp.]|nr:TetR/AcrR family transcriptional regulator [Novosphingobium sp.]MCP5404150.1 TetR/AcrR family transcriptional regulator [Novosphingobium sp.]
METHNRPSEVIPAPETGEEDIDRARLLIDAANELLDEGGLEGLTIRAVLKRTGLARRAFYERFAGKDGLVLAVFEETLLQAAQMFADQIRHIDDPLKTVEIIVTGLLSGALDRAGELTERRVAAMVREHLRLAESCPNELQAALDPLLDIIAEEVTKGIGTGQFRKCDPHLQATLIYNLVATTVHTELLMQEGGNVDRSRDKQFGEEIWEFCRRAIVA